MIKEAIEKILDLRNAHAINVHGKSYSRDELVGLPSPTPKPDMINMHTLSGFCRYLTEKLDAEIADGCAVLIDDFAAVSLVTKVVGDFNQRLVYACAKPFPMRPFPFAQYLDLENFVVGLQAHFVPDETTATILKVVGNVKSEVVQISQDDGVTQSVEARTGIARFATVSIPNPVRLRPYRTFQEVEQPASDFVLRIKKGEDEPMTAALFESTSEQWKVQAVESIKKYVEKNAKGFLVLA